VGRAGLPAKTDVRCWRKSRSSPGSGRLPKMTLSGHRTLTYIPTYASVVGAFFR
jgi:hypothetical protein